MEFTFNWDSIRMELGLNWRLTCKWASASRVSQWKMTSRSSQVAPEVTLMIINKRLVRSQLAYRSNVTWRRVTNERANNTITHHQRIKLGLLPRCHVNPIAQKNVTQLSPNPVVSWWPHISGIFQVVENLADSRRWWHLPWRHVALTLQPFPWGLSPHRLIASPIAGGFAENPRWIRGSICSRCYRLLCPRLRHMVGISLVIRAVAQASQGHPWRHRPLPSTSRCDVANDN